MLENINPYYMQWNTDVNGNPISVYKQEMHKCLLFFNSAEIVNAVDW